MTSRHHARCLSSTKPAHTALLLIAFIVVGAAVSGCASGPKPTPHDQRTTTTPLAQSERADRAVRAYHAGRFAETITIAEEMRRSGDQPQTAAYLAGLAAFRLGDFSASERFFESAVVGSDRWIAQRAGAMLGMIALETDRPRRAAELLERAANELAPPDGRDAARHAARAARRIGDDARARRMEALSGAGPGPSEQPGATVGRYVLQIGAFEDPLAARAAAEAHQAAVHRAGLGTIRVERVIDTRGRTLYAARFGRFTSHAEAERIRRREGWLAFLVRSVSGQ